MEIDRLIRSARRLRIVATVGLVLSLLLTFYALAGLSGVTGDGVDVRFGNELPGEAGGLPQLLALAGTGAALALAMRKLALMARTVEAGDAFGSATASDLRAFAAYILAAALIAILMPPVASLVRWHGSAGSPQRLTFSLDLSDALLLVVSALLFLLARLFGEARRLAEDNRQII